MTYRFTLLPLCVLVLSLITGCAINRSATADGAPLARQVTESDHCGLTAPGLVYVSSAGDLDKLAQLPSGNLALSMLAPLISRRNIWCWWGWGRKPLAATA